MPKGDRKMFKADIEDGYTKISNLLLKALYMAELTGLQTRMCLYLVSRTYSWGKKAEKIGLQEFADNCGSNKAYISKQLKDLIDKKVLLLVEGGQGVVSMYSLNTRLNEWQGCLDKLLHKTTTVEMNCHTKLQQSVAQNYNSLLHKTTTVTPPEATDDEAPEIPKERFKEIFKEKTDRQIDSIGEIENSELVNLGSGMPSPGEVPNSNPDGMPTPKEEKPPPDDGLKTICDYLSAKMGQLDIGSRNFSAVKKILEEPGMTKEIVIAGIDKSFTSYSPKYAGDKIRLFSYCRPAVMEEYIRVINQNGGETNDGEGQGTNKTPRTKRNVSKPKSGGTRSKDYRGGKYGKIIK